MSKVLNYLTNIPHDKLLHSFYGTLMYLPISYVDSFIALGIVAVIALSKEILDEKDYGGFDLSDIIATMLIPTLIYIKDVYSG